MELHTLINTVYLLSAVTFVLGFKLMQYPATVRQGNVISAVGMAAAVIVTLMDARVERYEYILTGLVAGTAAGLYAVSRAPLSGLPRLTGLFNGFGGLASGLVAWSEFHAHPAGQGLFGGLLLWLCAVLGYLAFSGSAIAWARTQAWHMGGDPVRFSWLHYLAKAVLLLVVVTGIMFLRDTVAPGAYRYFALFSLLALLLGALIVLPLDSAGIPAANYMLNGYAGLAACSAGFIFQNMLLVGAGALVAASSFRLMLVMCKAGGGSVVAILAGSFQAPSGSK